MRRGNWADDHPCGGYPEAFETSELHEPREADPAGELGHKVLDLFCRIAVALVTIAATSSWLPDG